MTEPEPPSAAAQAYFRAIEEHFIRLRGAPLLLSPTDWQVARGWLEAGIPVALVRETLEEIFRRRAERGAKGRVNSLRYCAKAVETAWAERQEVQGPSAAGPAAPLDVAAVLSRLAAALPARLPERASWQSRLASLASRLAPEVESALAALDAELLAVVREALAAEERAALSAEVESAWARVASRVPAAERDRVRTQLERQALRRLWALPLLSLFE